MSAVTLLYVMITAACLGLLTWYSRSVVWQKA
jgi:hypothetical protein